MPNPTIDAELLALVTATRPASVADVVDLQGRIDAILPVDDGLKWFNLVYMAVTRNVRGEGVWKDINWIDTLDVIFAQLYFDAVANYLRGNRVAKSWAVLFDARDRTDVDRILFALAGMNAHINHDLALALIQTSTATHIPLDASSPEHDDYETVNTVLAALIPQVLNDLAAGILGELAQDTGKVGQALAMWNVRAARDLAWDFAVHLSGLGGLQREAALLTQDQLTGVIGRMLLEL